MKQLPDLEINRAVRRILVRHWIDLGKLSIRSASAVCHLSGMLDKLPNVPPALTGTKIAEIFVEIRRVPALRRVDADFLNWQECGITWKLISPKTHSLTTPGDASAVPQEIPDLTKAALELELHERPE